MLDKIIENLFRMLTHDLYMEKHNIHAFTKKIKLMKVLFEMINLVETPN